MMTYVWLAIMIVLGAAEAVTLGLTTIWFAIGALLALIVAAIGLPLWLQIAVFLTASLVLILFTRPLAMKYFNKTRLKTNAESVVGKQAVVIETIDNLHATGRVNVSGQEWMARTQTEGEILTEGTVVEILSIGGVKVIVRKAEEA